MTRPQNPVASKCLYCVFSLCLIISYFPVAKCKPQAYQYVVPVQVQPPVLPHFGGFGGFWSLSPVRSPLHSRQASVINGYQYPISIPVVLSAQQEANNQHSFSAPTRRLSEEQFPINLADELIPDQTPTATYVRSQQRPLFQNQCGIRGSLLKSDLEQQSATFQSPSVDPTSAGSGSVLLTSLEFEGPDLSETAFHKHKGFSFIHSSKITYGIPTRNKEAPWQVAMFVHGKFHCGASLISDIHVLTAAHCVSSYRNRMHDLRLSLGDWDLNTKDDGTNVEGRVKKITVHPNFNFFLLQNDIAILELKNKVKFNDRIRPICLPPADFDIEELPITVTGWGRNEKNHLQTKLHKLTAIVLNNNLCAEKWSLTGAPPSLIGSETICMDAQFGDSCKGDSGGPAVKVYPPGSETFVQAGIVSFGSGTCTDAALPGVYTRVASFRDWIIEQITGPST